MPTSDLVRLTALVSHICDALPLARLDDCRGDLDKALDRAAMDLDEEIGRVHRKRERELDELGIVYSDHDDLADARLSMRRARQAMGDGSLATAREEARRKHRHALRDHRDPMRTLAQAEADIAAARKEG